MKKHLWFAIALCLLTAPAISSAQQTAFVIFLKESPPPTSAAEGDYFWILPANISPQAVLASGFHPFTGANSAAEAINIAAGLVANRFPQVCKKDTLRFVNPTLNPPVLFVNEFAAPKPFGYTYQGPPMCYQQANPVAVWVGNQWILPVFPRVAGTAPPVYPPNGRAVLPNPTGIRTPPHVRTPPQVRQPRNPEGSLPIPQPIPVGGFPDIKPIGPSIFTKTTTSTEQQTVQQGARGPAPVARPPAWPTSTQTQSTSTPVDSGVPNIAGTWRRDGWTEYAIQTISQSGRSFQWTHTYRFGPMRTEHATGNIEGSCSGANGYARAEVEITYTYADSTPTHKAGYTASLRCDASGRVTGISWSNNSSYSRVQ